MRQRKAKDLERRLAACRPYLIESPSAEAVRAAFPRKAPLYAEIGCGKGSFIVKQALAHRSRNFIAIEGHETVILRALERARDTAAGAGAQGPDTGGSMPETAPDADASAVCWPAATASETVPGSDASAVCPRDATASETAPGPVPVLPDADPAESGPLSNLRFICSFVGRMEDFFEESQLEGIYLNFSDPWPKARHVKRRLTYRDRLRDYGWALKPGGFIQFKTDNQGLFDFTLEEVAAVGYPIVELTRDLHGSCCEAKEITTEYEEKFRRQHKKICCVKIRVL